MLAVVLGTHAEVHTLEGVAAPMLADGRRLACEATRHARAPPYAFPGPVHRATAMPSSAHETHGARAGKMATGQVATGLRWRPSIERLAPVPRQGVPGAVDVAPTPHVPAKVRAVRLPVAPTVVALVAGPVPRLVQTTPCAALGATPTLPGGQLGLVAVEGLAAAHVGAGAIPAVAKVVEDVLVQVGQALLAATGATCIPAPLPRVEIRHPILVDTRAEGPAAADDGRTPGHLPGTSRAKDGQTEANVVDVAVEAGRRRTPKRPVVALARATMASRKAIGVEAPSVEGATLLLDGTKGLRAVAHAVAPVLPETEAQGRGPGPVPSVAADGVPVDRLLPPLA